MSDLSPQNSIRGEPLRLTYFHCRELLLDYLQERLDSLRREAIERELKSCPQLQEDLQQLKKTILSLQPMTQIQVQPQFLKNFDAVLPLKTKIAHSMKFKNWPDYLQWTSEALVISVVVGFIGWAVPWSDWLKLFSVQPPTYIVESKPVEVILPETQPEPSVIAQGPSPTVATGTNAPPTAVSPAAPSQSVSSPATTATSKPAAAVEATSSASVSSTTAMKGMLYRLMMNVPDIKNKAPELSQKIIALGGEKAGQVEIGHRQPKGNYFHFSLPEDNYPAFLKILEDYGAVRIYKGPHARVMPEGVIRIILTIEDGP